jgi:hypothetical protein
MSEHRLLIAKVKLTALVVLVAVVAMTVQP